MNKTLVSLAAVAALSTGAMAANKGIDIVTTGQAVVYYETHADGADDKPNIFNQKASAANVGVQLNLGADLGNGFAFGSQLSYIGTAGLENNLVSGVKQNAAMADNPSTTDDLVLSKIFVAKKIGNTTAKIGRQELPKSLSPLAFTEGWNVFKNTFEAIVIINSDIPDTTVVAAYVGATMGIMPMVDKKGATDADGNNIGDGIGDFNQYGEFRNSNPGNGVYMLTAQNKSIPMATITASYYSAPQALDAIWVDVKIKDKSLPMGLCVGLQGGQISPEVGDAGTAMGIKVGVKPIKPLALSVAYSSVDENAAFKNLGTGIKTPLFTQMIYNQNAIAKDNDTFVVKGVYNMGDMGKIIAQYGVTTAGKTGATPGNANNDYNELDVIYRLKAGGVAYWASVMMINTDNAGGIIGAAGDSDTKLRLWARKSF